MSTAALAQGGDAEVDDVEAEVEVFAEAAGFDHVGEVAGGGGEDAGGEGEDWSEPMGRTSLVLQGAQEAGLEVEGEFADLVEEEGAAVDAGEQADLGAARLPGTAPLAWPKSSPSIMAGTREAQSTGRKGLWELGPLAWMQRATSSLPVPDSPTMRTGWVVPATLERMR